MEWTEICGNKALQNLPFKIQTDRWGNIVMSPASNEHGIFQAKIVAALSRLLDSGTIISECSVGTEEGVKVADVAWASEVFMERNRGKNPFPEAPEICVEILSPSNSEGEMAEKKALYISKGAKEFWVCGTDGVIRFFDAGGPKPQSERVPEFPNRISE